MVKSFVSFLTAHLPTNTLLQSFFQPLTLKHQLYLPLEMLNLKIQKFRFSCVFHSFRVASYCRNFPIPLLSYIFNKVYVDTSGTMAGVFLQFYIIIRFKIMTKLPNSRELPDNMRTARNTTAPPPVHHILREPSKKKSVKVGILFQPA